MKNGNVIVGMSEQEIIEGLRIQATPIDFDALLAQGILEKSKGAWYKVLDESRLPESVGKRIVERNLGGSVKFSKDSKRAVGMLKWLSR